MSSLVMASDTVRWCTTNTPTSASVSARHRAAPPSAYLLSLAAQLAPPATPPTTTKFLLGADRVMLCTSTTRLREVAGESADCLAVARRTEAPPRQMDRDACMPSGRQAIGRLRASGATFTLTKDLDLTKAQLSVGQSTGKGENITVTIVHSFLVHITPFLSVRCVWRSQNNIGLGSGKLNKSLLAH